MKKLMKRIGAVLMAVAMMAALGVSAWAVTQEKELSPANADNATITINNPAKGETYKIYKLFDATVSNGKISYQSSSIPEGLTDFFDKDANNNITPKAAIMDDDETIMTTQLQTALETWAATATVTAQEVSDGSEALAFTKLPYGYYVITTTHTSDAAEGETAKAAITVTSTKPDASIKDKNVNTPTATKEVEEESYSIGDTVKYTATFDTTNYMTNTTTGKSQQVIEYVISDTLPEFLDPATTKITKIMIGATEYKVDGEVPQFNKKSITIPWASKNDGTPVTYNSLYAQGTQIVINYEAKLTSTTNINAADKNTVSIKPYVDKDDGTGDKEPWSEDWKDSAEIKTFGAAIRKEDATTHASLTGAEFTVKGLVVEAVTGETGVYRVVSYDPTSNTQSDAMATNDQGMLYIVGLASDASLVVTESKAPAGYQKLVETKTVNPQDLEKTIYETSGSRNYDKDGNLVSESVTGGSTTTVTKNYTELDAEAFQFPNTTTAELPSTGGIGTYVFTIAGVAIMAIAAGLLIVRHKKKAE